MIKKKICLIGSFGVGKTSLVSRYVRGIFSEKYLSTVGVMISQKSVSTPVAEMLLMVWDLAGEDDFHEIRPSFLKGASGMLYVADGTRGDTLSMTREHIERMGEIFAGIPGVVLLNKRDLSDRWEVTDSDLKELPPDVDLVRTSAKTGENVEEAFERLVELMVIDDESATENSH